MMNNISALLITIVICIISCDTTSQDLKKLESNGHLYIEPTLQNLVLLENMDMKTFNKAMISNKLNTFSSESELMSFITGEFPTRFQTVTKDSYNDVTSMTWMNEKDLDIIKEKLKTDLKSSLVDSGKQYDTYIKVIDDIVYKVRISNGDGSLVELMIGHPR